MDEPVKDKGGIKVAFADLNASPAEKATAIKILDNYIANYEREINNGAGSPAVDA